MGRKTTEEKGTPRTCLRCIAEGKSPEEATFFSELPKSVNRICPQHTKANAMGAPLRYRSHAKLGFRKPVAEDGGALET